MVGNDTLTEGRNWHALRCQDVLEVLDSTADGLNQEAAEKRLQTCGRNSLPQARRRSAVFRFLSQFHNVLIYVLLACAVITLSLEHLLDTAVILAVVVANAAIGFVQEGKAESAMEAIRRMLAPRAVVLRDGKRRHIDAESLVPGDVVLVCAGDKVPADLRLLKANGLGIQEAILTGESVPVEKDAGAVS